MPSLVTSRPLLEHSVLIEVIGAFDDALTIWAGIDGALRAAPRHVVVDLTRVTFCDPDAIVRLTASHDSLLIVPPRGRRALLSEHGAERLLVNDVGHARTRLERLEQVEAERARLRHLACVGPGLVERLRASLFPEAAPVEVRETLLFGGHGGAERRGCLIEVAGPFDERAAPLIERAVARATESGASAVAIDLSRALALGERAIGWLLAWADRLEERGVPLVLVNVATGARSSFERLDPAFVVCDDLRGLQSAARRGPITM